MRQTVLIIVGCASLVLGLLVYAILRGEVSYGFPLKQILNFLAPFWQMKFVGVLPQEINDSLPSLFWQLSLSSFYYAVFCARAHHCSLKEILTPFCFGFAEEISQYFRKALWFDAGDLVAICIAASAAYLVAFTLFKPT